MARISLVQLSTFGPRNFYNVNKAVGAGCPNQRTDVLLTQYFLQQIFKHVPDFQTDPYPGGVVVIDGIAGPQTFSAILHFQKVAKKRGWITSQDGRVDPPVGEQSFGSISHTQYTILSMNSAFKKGRPQDWPRVSRASDCPGELRQPLREPKFMG